MPYDSRDARERGGETCSQCMMGSMHLSRAIDRLLGASEQDRIGRMIFGETWLTLGRRPAGQGSPSSRIWLTKAPGRFRGRRSGRHGRDAAATMASSNGEALVPIRRDRGDVSSHRPAAERRGGMIHGGVVEGGRGRRAPKAWMGSLVVESTVARSVAQPVHSKPLGQG
jgi:hypothetical protein